VYINGTRLFETFWRSHSHPPRPLFWRLAYYYQEGHFCQRAATVIRELCPGNDGGSFPPLGPGATPRLSLLPPPPRRGAVLGPPQPHHAAWPASPLLRRLVGNETETAVHVCYINSLALAKVRVDFSSKQIKIIDCFIKEKKNNEIRLHAIASGRGGNNDATAPCSNQNLYLLIPTLLKWSAKMFDRCQS